MVSQYNIVQCIINLLLLLIIVILILFNYGCITIYLYQQWIMSYCHSVGVGYLNMWSTGMVTVLQLGSRHVQYMSSLGWLGGRSWLHCHTSVLAQTAYHFSVMHWAYKIFSLDQKWLAFINFIRKAVSGLFMSVLLMWQKLNVNCVKRRSQGEDMMKNHTIPFYIQ